MQHSEGTLKIGQVVKATKCSNDEVVVGNVWEKDSSSYKVHFVNESTGGTFIVKFNYGDERSTGGGYELL
jgi:hypothetical protein